MSVSSSSTHLPSNVSFTHGHCKGRTSLRDSDCGLSYNNCSPRFFQPQICNMDMVVTTPISSATMNMAMPTGSSTIAAATSTAAMSMSMGGDSGCKLSVSAPESQFKSRSRSCLYNLDEIYKNTSPQQDHPKFQMRDAEKMQMISAGDMSWKHNLEGLLC